MDPRLQRRVQRYGWDRAAAYYEGYWARQLEPAQNLLLEGLALKPGERVLETACGTGLMTFPAAAAVGRSGAVTATDLSGEMVTRIRARAEELGTRHVTAERMDAETLAYPDAGFDAVFCALGLMYVPDPAAALGEMLRVLRPGGRAAAAVWGARKNCGWAEIFPIVDSRVESDVCPLFFQLGTGSVLASTFTRAGFTEVAERRIDTVLEYAGEEDALGAAFLGGPVALAYSRFDDAVRDAAHHEYLDSIESFRDGGGYRIPGEFVVVTGRRPA